MDAIDLREWVTGAMRSLRHPRALDLPRTWQSEQSRPTTIALLDDGVRRRIPPLAAVDIEERSFVRSGPGDHGLHGTLCATTLAGNSPLFRGLVPGARLVSAKIRAAGCSIAAVEIDAALRWVCGFNPTVLCLPFGRTRACPSLARALRDLRERGVTIFAAAGNRSEDQLLCPASSKGVTAVGAAGLDGEWIPGCYRGDGVDVVAPGESVPSWGTEGPCTFGRTSAACAIAAGVAAVSRSERGGH